MSRKRRNTSSPELSPSPHRKRVVSPSLYDDAEDSDEPQASKEKPQVNAVFGQTGAFPGLGDEDDGEMFYGPANDGIGYLRMVRSEARGVPILLTAPRNDRGGLDANGEEHVNGGYWEDGAYTAAASTPPPNSATKLSPAQSRYYDSLLAQFRLLQATLRCTPPLEAVQTLSPEVPISFPADSKKAWAQWKQHVQSADPSMVQMACMDVDSGWKLLKLLRKMIAGVTLQPRRVGTWAWAVLGRCPDSGQMVSEEVSEVRALGKAAVALLHAEDLDADDEEEPQADEAEGPLPGDAQYHEKTTIESASRVALDMIITIVGEVYGQRDLLERREMWQRSEA